MNKLPRRRLAPQARKLEIVEAAERLMLAHGDQVRVEDVVREAGVAKGTFFLYFPTWDDLLSTIRDRLVAEFDALHPMPSADGAVDWPGLLETQAVAFIDFTLARQGFGAAIFHTDFAERRPFADNAVVRLAGLIRAGRAAQAFGEVDADPTARLLFAVIHEAADAIAGGDDREAMLEALRQLMRRALMPL